LTGGSALAKRAAAEGRADAETTAELPSAAAEGREERAASNPAESATLAKWLSAVALVPAAPTLRLTVLAAVADEVACRGMMSLGAPRPGFIIGAVDAIGGSADGAAAGAGPRSADRR
jgi:hypothetical protein